MEKSFIMKIDDRTDLLEREQQSGKLQTHPVAFPIHRLIPVRRETAMTTILETLAGYEDRAFIATPYSYGVEMSINYVEGKLDSIILKGTGAEGERVMDNIAALLAPAQAKKENNITLHALLTTHSESRFRIGMTKQEVPKILKQALREGFRPYEHKKVIFRPYTLFINGVKADLYDLWHHISPLLIPGLYLHYTYEELKRDVGKVMQEFPDYHTPVRGVLLEDQKSEEDSAFPTTLFLFDDQVVEMEKTQL